MTAADKAKLLALALDFDRRANTAFANRNGGGGEFYAGRADAYDYAGDELRALIAEMGDDDGHQ